jgi:hypothetical protein
MRAGSLASSARGSLGVGAIVLNVVAAAAPLTVIGGAAPFNSNLVFKEHYVRVTSDGTINTKTSLRILRQPYTDMVLNTVIPRNTDVRDAHFNKQDVFAFSPGSTSAQAYNRLIDEVFV